MILSGKEIHKRIGQDIIINPYNIDQLNPNSYDLCLHDELLVYDEEILDMKKENPTSLIKIPEEGLMLQPNVLYLGRTVEYTETHKLVPALEGRSSVGRLGLSIHISSPLGNVGFKGYWTLEISCVQPIIIYPHVRVCQIYYHTIKGSYDLYRNKYQSNNSVQPSKLFEELRIRSIKNRG